MKKIIVIIIISVALLAGIGGGIYFWISNLPESTGGYSQADLDKAKEQGKESGAAYREYLDNLLDELEKRIDSGVDFDEDAFRESYEELMDKLSEQLKSQEDGLGEIVDSKIAMYTSTRVSLVGLADMYGLELNRLNGQLTDINKAIDDLKALGGDIADQLQGLEFAKSFIEKDIASYNTAITSINAQIADIDQILADLRG